MTELKMSEALTKKVAGLARLKLTPEEVKRFTPQLEGILKFIDQLSEVQVNGVEPLLHPIELPSFLREDVAVDAPRSSSGSSQVIECGPDVVDDGYRVPPIIG